MIPSVRPCHKPFDNLISLAKEDVKVQVEDGCVLQITGARNQEKPSPLIVGTVRSFLHRFYLPENAKVEEVKAAMENGILIITVPKAAPTNRKTLVCTINIDSSS
ncbi:hypothetical protein L7F22_028183 [Adiantum nelumboides]|nr:hypothetical protein [Adiantum nelumboides]